MRPALRPPEPNFGHLIAMTDERGTFEHALYREPRPEHGYCTDDMARVLVVATREPSGTPALRHLAVLSLRFLLEALEPQGKCRNRMNRHGTWDDPPALNDCWGRCIWGLGTAASHSDDDEIRHRAIRGLEQAMRPRSSWPRATAFAALGAAELLSVHPDDTSARSLLADAADSMTRVRWNAGWPWPEQRLTYANATLPEAMIAAGSTLRRPVLMKPRAGSLGMAARSREPPRASLGHARRGSRPHRPWTEIRPTAHRSGGNGRCVCPRHDG